MVAIQNDPRPAQMLAQIQLRAEIMREREALRKIRNARRQENHLQALSDDRHRGEYQ